MAGFKQNGSFKKKLVIFPELCNALLIYLLQHISDYIVIA